MNLIPLWYAMHSRSLWKMLTIVRTNQSWLKCSFLPDETFFQISYSHYQDLSYCSDVVLPAYHIFSYTQFTDFHFACLNATSLTALDTPLTYTNTSIASESIPLSPSLRKCSRKVKPTLMNLSVKMCDKSII